jgi:ABC-type spermidine/putrescine transport system permease subunit II
MSDVTDLLRWRPRLALTALLALGLFLLLPVFITLLLSLQQNGDLDPFAGSFGLDGWAHTLRDGNLWFLLLCSTSLALLVGVAASLLALAPAYIAAVIGGRWRQVVLILSLMVLLGDQAVTVMGWSEIGRQLARWLFDADASSGRYAIGGLMTFVAETHRALPIAILCQYLAMTRHDPALIEVGLECGAHHARLLRRVVWPLAWPGLLIGILAGFALSLGATLEPTLLNTGAISLGERLQQILELDGNWPQGSRLVLLSLGLILLAVAAAAFLLSRQPGLRRNTRRDTRQSGDNSPARPTLAFRLALNDPLLPAAVIALGWLALPLAWMLVLSLRYLFGIAITAGPGLFIQAIIDDPHLLPAIGTGTITALIAALLASFGGAGLAVIWRNLLLRGNLRSRDWAWLLLTALPFLLPGLLLSTLHLIAHLFLAIYLPSGLGIVAVALADGLRAMPLVAVVMLIFWQRLPADLDEITDEFALNRQRLWRQILQPSLHPAWVIAILVAVLLSLGDFQLANALSGDRAMLSPSLLAGIATQRSPIYLALMGPLLALTAWLCRLILTRLDRRNPIRSQQAAVTGLGLSMNITTRKT